VTHRRADVYLDPKEPRCSAFAHGCDRKMTCGRYLANINGAPLQDYSIGPDFDVPFWVPVCNDWVAVERPPASTPAKPKIHPPLTLDPP
jgi:hypothetical protein